VAIGQQVALGAALAAVGGVAPRRLRLTESPLVYCERDRRLVRIRFVWQVTV
jgi:hypothetical protein